MSRLLEVRYESDNGDFFGQVISAETDDIDWFQKAVKEHVLARSPAYWGFRAPCHVDRVKDFEFGKEGVRCVCRVVWSKETSTTPKEISLEKVNVNELKMVSEL